MEVVADFESHGLVQPFSINVMDNGNVVIIDINLKKVLVIKPTGEISSKFGQEGKGSGEFIMPSDIQFVRNSINIIDINQYKVLKFDYEGSFVESYTYKTKSVKRNIILLDDQVYVSNTKALNSNLLGM